jgi:LmbE family N-acetylglucosaminyl deacetylase
MNRRQLLTAGAIVAASSTMRGSTMESAAAATGRPVIFCSPHPDDDALAMGVAIARHVAAGRDVHVLAVTPGESTAARAYINGTATSGWWGMPHHPTVEGYAPLTEADCGAARIREITASAGVLGVPKINLHEGGVGDGFGGTDPNHVPQSAIDIVKTMLVDLVKQFPNAGLWGPSYLVDNHPDHRAVGLAIRQLGKANPTKYYDRRYAVLPMYWSDTRLSQVPIIGWMTPANSLERARAAKSCYSYGAWEPRSGAFAIGWHSFGGWLGKIMANPKCLVHKD